MYVEVCYRYSILRKLPQNEKSLKQMKEGS
jgi:hypothetical protein